MRKQLWTCVKKFKLLIININNARVTSFALRINHAHGREHNGVARNLLEGFYMSVKVPLYFLTTLWRIVQVFTQHHDGICFYLLLP